MDIVIPYRRSYSEELKYCLRSLVNIPHKEVFVIGDKPDFNVRYIYSPQKSDVASNTFKSLNLACRTPEISDDFIWTSDDIFIMNPLKKLPIHHRGEFRRIIQAYDNSHKFNYYTKRAKETYKRLKALGVANPLSYELHIPFVINKKKWLQISPEINGRYNKLSMYGNLNKIGGTKARDVKVRQKDWIPESNFISTYDSTFGTNQVGKLIRERFPERSIYE